MASLLIDNIKLFISNITYIIYDLGERGKDNKESLKELLSLTLDLPNEELLEESVDELIS